MSWARIDDMFHAHPKAMDAGLEAIGLWAMALAHCANYLTDGHVKRSAAQRIAGAELDRLSAALVRVGLWEVHPTDGWSFHDYLDYNPSREQVLAERAVRKQRAQNAATKRWQGHPSAAPHHATEHATEHASSKARASPKHQPQHRRADAPGPGPGPGPVPSPDPAPVPPTQLSLRSGESDHTTANGTPAPRSKPTKHAQVERDAQEALDTWIAAREGRFSGTKRHRPPLNPERLGAVANAVAHGYSLDAIKLAVRGFVLNGDNKHASRAEGFVWALEDGNIDNNIDRGQKVATLTALDPRFKEKTA